MIPVERGARGGVVGQMVRRFEAEDAFVLGVAPEGTRRPVEAWRTGFYRIAEGAGVPIALVALDFGRKEIRMGPTFFPSSDPAADFARMETFFATSTPKRPGNAGALTQPLTARGPRRNAEGLPVASGRDSR